MTETTTKTYEAGTQIVLTEAEARVLNRWAYLFSPSNK